MNPHYVLRIVCRAESHGGKEVLIGCLASRNYGEDKTTGGVILIDERPVDGRLVWGGVNGTPDREMVRAFSESGRTRHEFECRLCGLRVELTEATATTLMRGLIASVEWSERQYRPEHVGEESDPLIFRESSLNLEALAASM